MSDVMMQVADKIIERINNGKIKMEYSMQGTIRLIDSSKQQVIVVSRQHSGERRVTGFGAGAAKDARNKLVKFVENNESKIAAGGKKIYSNSLTRAYLA